MAIVLEVLKIEKKVEEYLKKQAEWDYLDKDLALDFTDVEEYGSYFEDDCVVGLQYDNVEICDGEDGMKELDKFFEYIEKNYLPLNKHSNLVFSIPKNMKNIVKEKNIRYKKDKEPFTINYNSLEFYGTFEEFILNFNESEDAYFEIIRVLDVF